jgi:hypothetical protein
MLAGSDCPTPGGLREIDSGHRGFQDSRADGPVQGDQSQGDSPSPISALASTALIS